MAYNKKFTVGLLVASITDPFSNSVAKGAMLAAEDLDINLIIVPGKYIDRDYNELKKDSQYEYQYNALFSHVSTNNLDYLIVCIGTIAYLSDSKMRLKMLNFLGNTPILTVADKFDEYEHLIFDNNSGVSEAVDFLINKSGCKKIAMMVGDLNNYECMERFNAYRHTLESNGIEFDETLAAASDISEDCYEEARALLEAHPDIDGIVCANDAIANTVYRVLKEKELRIGRDVCVVGFDDQPSSAKLEPPLASVRADASILGYRAVEKASDYLNGINNKMNKVKTSFIPRASCFEDINSLIYSYDLFSGTVDEVSSKIINYIFDKPISNTIYNQGYDFVSSLITEFKEKFIDKDADENCVHCVIDKFNDFLNSNIDLTDVVEPIFIVADCCYKWISSQISEKNRGLLKQAFDYLYKRLSMDIVSTYKYIDDQRKEHNHLANLVIRDTLMLENSLKNNYSYILRKLPYIGINTGYLYLFKEPIAHRNGEAFPTDVDWRFKSYHYGFDTFLVPEQEQKLTPAQLFNNPYLPDNRRYTLIMIDLYSNEFQYGIALCEPKNSDFFNDVELVTYQLSAAVKIIALLKKQEQMLTELHTKNQALENMSMVDELTGIYNRRGFYNAANQLIQEKQYKNKKLIVAYADMDNLKMVNDAFGHIEGDFSLKALAGCLTSIFGKVFVAGRVGGDEYAIVAVEEFSGDIEEILRKKQAYIEQLNKTAQKPYKINMSMGMYECYCQNSYDLKDAIDKADDLLYQQKQLRKKEI